MSKQLNNGRVNAGRSRSQSNRSDAGTKPGTTPSKAAVRINVGGDLKRPNIGPKNAPYYESEADKKDFF
jgi:hypothetical protein